MERTLKDWSWASLIDCIWDMFGVKITQIDFETVFKTYGPAVVEQIVRDEARLMLKLTPTFDEIERAYHQVGGQDSRRMEELHSFYLGAVSLASAFGDANGDGMGVSWSNRWATSAQVIYILASGMEDPVRAQNFMRKFFPDRQQFSQILDPEEFTRWKRYELEVGLGQFAAICHAKQISPKLQAEDLAAAMLKKYGVPGMVNGTAVYGCAWCGSPPCFCKGRRLHLEETLVGPKRQTHGRKITLEDVKANHLHRGPRDTLETMRVAYGFGNAARAGSSFGAFRCMLELVVEGGIADAYAVSGCSAQGLSQRLGPFYKGDQFHIKEVVGRDTLDPAEQAAEHTKEHGDRVHWQDLFWPQMNMDEGLRDALVYLAQGLGVELELPDLPKLVG